MTTRTSTKTPPSVAGIVKIGHGGWTAHYRRQDTEGGYSSGSLHGYGRWHDAVDEITGALRRHPGYDEPGARERHRAEHLYPDDIPFVDLTVVDEQVLRTLAYAGPMVGVDVPAGHVRKLAFPSVNVPWDPTPIPERDADLGWLGNARALDYVAPDVYVGLARQVGAITTTVGEVKAALAALIAHR